MYNVTTNDIIRLNPGCDEKIYAGQAIKNSLKEKKARKEKHFIRFNPEKLYIN